MTPVRISLTIPGLLAAALLVVDVRVARGQYSYTTNAADTGTITITGYKGSGGAVAIPDSIDGKTVTGIGVLAFHGANLTSVTIPANVSSIGNEAFGRCAGLANVTIPGSVTKIGDRAFDRCSKLACVTISDGVNSIGDSAFTSCSSLANIWIPKSVVSIGTATFDGCSSLTSITIPENVTSIGVQCFYCCTSLTNVVIPRNVTSIGMSAFASCGLTGVTIPPGVVSIGGSAFHRCSGLTTVAIPGCVTNVGSGAFDGCRSLMAITVESSNAVYSSADGVLFDKNRQTLIQFPGGRGGSYTIPASVTNIENWVFPLTEIKVDPSNSAYSSVDGVLFDKGQKTLVRCPLNKAGSVTIPSGVANINGGAFVECTSLTNVTMPASVTNIGEFAFTFCTGLTTVCFNGDAPSVGDFAFCCNGGERSTVYYLPGTKGWGAVFGDRPTKLWKMTNEAPGNATHEPTVPQRRSE